MMAGGDHDQHAGARRSGDHLQSPTKLQYGRQQQHVLVNNASVNNAMSATRRQNYGGMKGRIYTGQEPEIDTDTSFVQDDVPSGHGQMGGGNRYRTQQAGMQQAARRGKSFFLYLSFKSMIGSFQGTFNLRASYRSNATSVHVDSLTIII